ncbi:MAG: DUF2442 domain-containing protein [Candidatus Sulfotelmatobacter sp.]
MSSSAIAADERVLDVAFDDDALSVSLRDGRVISVPLVWYPRLLNATSAQRKNWKIAGGGYGIHWPELDEDLSTEGLLRGGPASKTAAAKSKSVAAEHDLTDRDRQVLSLLAAGRTNKEIASQLQVSREAILTHLQRIFRTLKSGEQRRGTGAAPPGRSATSGRTRETKQKLASN